MRKRIFIGSGFFVGIIFLLHLIISFNEGFSLKKVLTKLSKNPSWNTPVLSPTDTVMQVLNQPFKYLGRGGQVFVFESQDGEYVMKLIRYDLLTPTLTMKLQRHFFSDQAKHLRKNKRYMEANESYYRAFTDLSEFTNVHYSHLVKTDFFKKKLTLIDKLGKLYLVDLDSLGFVLQKKAQLLGDVLLKLKTKNESQKIQQILSSYLILLANRSAKGFWIKDHNQFLWNYGLCNDKVYEIDVGSYRFKNTRDIGFFQKNNLDHLERIHMWIQEMLPEHLTFFNKKIQEIIIQNEI